MSLVIRPLTENDRPAWESLWRGYLTFYRTAVAEDVFDTTFSRLISGRDGEFRCLVAERDGEAVGIAHILSHRHCWRVENVVYLQDLFVTESERGRGTGRALIEAVYALADSEGTPAVYWLTQEGNAPARRLYDGIAKLTDFIKYQR